MYIARMQFVSMFALLYLVGSQDASAQDMPEKAALTAKGPVGLFFMTRYWSFTQTLEKAVWYFSSAGDVYENLQTGFSREDLAAHKGRKGKLQSDGKKITVQWSDGKTEQGPIEPDTKYKNVFMWELGTFIPATPFADSKAAVGSYEGGESVNVGGNKAATAQTLELKADGSFTWSGVGLVQGGTDKSKLEAGSTGTQTGKWKLSGYSLILTGSDGKSARRIAFPFDDEDTPIKPDHMFFGGLLLKKKS